MFFQMIFYHLYQVFFSSFEALSPRTLLCWCSCVCKEVFEIIKHDFDNAIALKLRNACVEGNGDIIFVSAYIPSYSSPYYKTVEYDNGIHMLEQCITELQTKHSQCSFILCGDLNARTSCVALNGVRKGIQIC